MSALTIDSGATPFAPSIVGGTPTTAQVFPAINYPNAGLNSVAVSTPGPLSLSVPNNGQYEQKRFAVVASGKVTLGSTASPTLTWKMYNGTSMTVASDGTALLTMSALTGLTVSATYPWTWATVFQGDSTSGILQAVSSTLWVNNATAGTITLTGIASGVNFGGSTALISSGYSTAYALNLIMAFTFGVASAANKCYCSQYYLES